MTTLKSTPPTPIVTESAPELPSITIPEKTDNKVKLTAIVLAVLSIVIPVPLPVIVPVVLVAVIVRVEPANAVWKSVMAVPAEERNKPT